MAKWLKRSPQAPKVSGSKHSLCRGNCSNSVHPAVRGYLTLFRVREGEGVGIEEWHSDSVTLLQAQSLPHTAING